MRDSDQEQMNIFVDTPFAITKCDTFSAFLDANPAPTEGVDYAFGKAWSVLRTKGRNYPTIMVSVSGGSDSDISECSGSGCGACEAWAVGHQIHKGRRS